MPSTNPIFMQKYTDRQLIESIINSYYIVDYGYIQKVNADGTIDVTHAKKQTLITGEELQPDLTKGVECLTLSCHAFSIQLKLHEGDKVLLLGLKDYIPQVKEVTNATSQDSYIHYCRNTMKALPLCVFDDDAKVQVKIENGNVTMALHSLKIGQKLDSNPPALEVTA